MKIKVEFDLTPQEFRQSLGLPDVSGLQDKAISALQSRLSAGVKDVDVSEVVESWLTQGLATSRQIQKLFSAAVSGAMDSGDDPSKKKPPGPE